MYKLRYRKMDHSKYNYILEEHFQYLLSKPWPEVHLPDYWARIEDYGEWLKVRVFYMWDGLSGPAFDTEDTRVPTLVHDSLYQLIAEGMLPLKPFKLWADREFLKCLKENGVYFLRRQRMYWAVRLFGRARDKYEI